MKAPRGWKDPKLVADVAALVQRGVSMKAAAGSLGMSTAAVATWMFRYDAEMQEIAEATEAGEDAPEMSAFAVAVTPIARARWAWVAEMEERAQAGDSGAQWMLPRRVQDVYGAKQEVTVAASNDSGVAKLLSRLAGDAT